MMKKLLICLTLLLVLPISGCLYYGYDDNSVSRHSIGQVTVHYLDVGQANCSIVQLPDNKILIIDAGNNDDNYIIEDYLSSLGIDTIDYLVGTHPHEDHIGCIDFLINNYDVKNLYMPYAETDKKTYLDVLDACENKNLYINRIFGGDSIYSSEDLNIEAVAPNNYYDDINNSSIVIHLTYKDASFLFTGDAEYESERDITQNIESDVLLVSHHGSSTSTSKQFLYRIDPMYAVISCGKNNDYGHPHHETLSLLQDEDITIYRTDLSGTVICQTKGVQSDYTFRTLGE